MVFFFGFVSHSKILVAVGLEGMALLNITLFFQLKEVWMGGVARFIPFSSTISN